MKKNYHNKTVKIQLRDFDSLFGKNSWHLILPCTLPFGQILKQMSGYIQYCLQDITTFSSDREILLYLLLLAKKESRLKFYCMSFASHSIGICIFLCFKLSPGRSGLYLRAIYVHPIKMQLSLFVKQLRCVHFNYIYIYIYIYKNILLFL